MLIDYPEAIELKVADGAERGELGLKLVGIFYCVWLDQLCDLKPHNRPISDYRRDFESVALCN